MRYIGMAVWGFAWMLLTTAPAAGQYVTGCVLDTERGTPLPGAHVTAAAAGAVADSTGCFRLALPAGPHTLTAHMLGYGAVTQSVIASPDHTAHVVFRLRPEAIPLQQLEVVADRLPAAATALTTTTVTPAEVTAHPGATADVLRTLQATPGVVSPSDFSSQLIVRGSRPDENLITIDGVEIFNPHRLHGVVSVFNPVLLEDATLHAGGFSARYGDRLAAVLDVETRSGTHREWLRGTVNTSLSNANVALEGRTGFWDGAWIAAGRRTYYDLILDALDARLGAGERMTYPNFADLQGKLTLFPSATHRIDAGMLTGRDALDMTLQGAEGRFTSAADRLRADETSRNEMAYVRWQWRPWRALALTTTASGYRNRGTAHSGGQLVPQDRLLGGEIVPSLDTTNVFRFDAAHRFRLRTVSLQQRVEWTRGRHAFEAGLALNQLQTRLAYGLASTEIGDDYLEVLQQTQPLGLGMLPGTFNRTRTYGRYALYVQDRVSLLNDRLHIAPGLRLSHYGLMGQSVLAPRLQLRAALSPTTTLRGAWGRYSQSPGYEKLMMSRDRMPLSEATDLSRLRAERATHYVVGLTHQWGHGYSVTADAYLKTMHDLIVPAWQSTATVQARYTGKAPRTHAAGYALERTTTWQRTAMLTNNGSGRAYGMEITLRKAAHRTARLSGHISYTYARSTRSAPLAETTTVQRPFVYDRRHTLNAVGTLRLSSHWTFAASFRFGTGFPHTTPTGVTPVVVGTEQDDARILTHSQTGAVRFTPTFGGPERRGAARLPAYHRLDLRLARAVDWSAVSGRFYLDVINVYNRRNVLSYQYAAVTDPSTVRPLVYQQALYMLPIVPSIGIQLQF